MKSDFLVTENTETEPEHTESIEPSVASICFSVHSVSRSLLRLLRLFAAKTAFVLGLSLLVAASLPAQENPVTESTVALVPAGGEITRSYSANQVSVRMVSRPYFSPAPAGWPALEVGPASLTFVRDTAGGALVLLGDQPLSLPFAIALGQDGRSVQPLDFTFGYDQPKATATLTLSGQDFSLAATAPTGPIPVVVAAGTATDWPITALEITPGATTTASSTSDDTKSSTSESKPLRPTPAERQHALETAAQLFAAGEDERAAQTLAAGNRKAKDSPAGQIETAQMLTRLAVSFAAKGEATLAKRLASLALRYVEEGLAQATPDLAVDGHELAGFLYQNFLGEWAKARASYQKAAEANPKSSAGETLAWMARTEQEATLKGRR